MPLIDDINVLFKKKNVIILDNWINECCEHFISEEPGIKVASLFEKVWEQWTLEEIICKPSLPTVINSETNPIKTLPGVYTLQLNYVIDISQSAYKQLEQLNNVIRQELEEEQQVKEHSNRMLKMQFTDGVTTVYGLELTPIPEISTNIKPGVKVQLTGPIRVVKTQLFLEAKNVTVLGGEVDTLLEVNSQVNVLLRSLKLTKMPDFGVLHTPHGTDAFEKKIAGLIQNNHNSNNLPQQQQPMRQQQQQPRPCRQPELLLQQLRPHAQNPKSKDQQPVPVELLLDDDDDFIFDDILQDLDQQQIGHEENNLNDTDTELSVMDDLLSHIDLDAISDSEKNRRAETNRREGLEDRNVSLNPVSKEYAVPTAGISTSKQESSISLNTVLKGHAVPTAGISTSKQESSISLNTVSKGHAVPTAGILTIKQESSISLNTVLKGHAVPTAGISTSEQESSGRVPKNISNKIIASVNDLLLVERNVQKPANISILDAKYPIKTSDGLPLVYLYQINEKKDDISNGFKFSVVAKVKECIRSISVNETCWNLSVLIKDRLHPRFGTPSTEADTLPVDLSTTVIEEITGYTPATMMELRKSKDPITRTEVLGMLTSMRERLTNGEFLMSLHRTSDNFVVVKLVECGDDHTDVICDKRRYD